MTRENKKPCKDCFKKTAPDPLNTMLKWAVIENIAMFIMAIAFAVYVKWWLFWVPLLFVNTLKKQKHEDKDA